MKLLVIAFLLSFSSIFACDKIVGNIGQNTDFDTNYYSAYYFETGDIYHMPIIVLNASVRQKLDSVINLPTNTYQVCLFGTFFDRIFYAYDAQINRFLRIQR